MTEPQHETTLDFIPDGEEMITLPASIIIVTTSYLEQIASIKKERERRIATNSKAFLADVFKCLDPINNKLANEVTIRIVADRYFEPKLISYKYIIERSEFTKKPH